MTPPMQTTVLRGPIRRPSYALVLDLPGMAESILCPRCAANPRSPCSARQPDFTLLPVAPHAERVAAMRRRYRVEAVDLDHLADIVEAEVRAVHPNTHVGVRLDVSGTIWVRLGWADSQPAGTWTVAA